MSFLDNLGNAINTAYDGVSKKAKDTTDILKLTQNIKQLRGSIEIQYLNIGKKYFNNHKDEPVQGEYGDEMMIIKEAMRKIEQLEREIEKIKYVPEEVDLEEEFFKKDSPVIIKKHSVEFENDAEAEEEKTDTDFFG